MDREMLGRFIAQRRKERNMTQRELAEKLHVTDKAVSKWERGAGCPDISLLEPLAEALELSVDQLLTYQTAPEEPEAAGGACHISGGAGGTGPDAGGTPCPSAQTLVHRYGGNAEPDCAGGGVCISEQPASARRFVPQRKQHITRRAASPW